MNFMQRLIKSMMHIVRPSPDLLTKGHLDPYASLVDTVTAIKESWLVLHLLLHPPLKCKGHGDPPLMRVNKSGLSNIN